MGERLQQLAALLMPKQALGQMFQQLPPSQQPPAAPAAQPLLGNGMAQQAAQAVQSRPYTLHVQEAKAMGEQPMTAEQFAAQQKQ